MAVYYTHHGQKFLDHVGGVAPQLVKSRHVTYAARLLETDLSKTQASIALLINFWGGHALRPEKIRPRTVTPPWRCRTPRSPVGAAVVAALS